MNDLVEVPTPIADSKFVAMLCNFQSITSFVQAIEFEGSPS
jgi:hypothetical protein